MHIYDLNTPSLIDLGVKYLQAQSRLLEHLDIEKWALEDLNLALSNHAEAYATGFNPGAILVANNILDSNTKNYNRCRAIRIKAQDIVVQTHCCLVCEKALDDIYFYISIETEEDEQLHKSLLESIYSKGKAYDRMNNALDKYLDLVTKEENTNE